MTARRPRILTAEPQHWPVRMEIMKAIHLLAAQEQEEQQRQRRAELAAIRRDCELLSETIREVCRELVKAGFNPNEPRVPAGNPDGGEWTSEGGSGTSNDSPVVSDATPDNNWKPGAQYAANDPPGIGHNQGPPLEDPPPQIPPNTSSESEVWDFVKAAVRWLVKAGVTRLVGAALEVPVAEFLAAVGAAYWLYKYTPTIFSYFDPPKTWEELQQNNGRGYDIHHVVERWSARDGVPSSMIFSRDNEVPIPKLKHWEINSWLDTPTDEFEDADGNELTPRQYLRGKSWEERRRVGINALIRFQVLKP